MSGKKKIDPRDYVVTPETEISTIDLDREEFTLQDGRRLTEELAEKLAQQAQDEIRRRNLVPGRKSLSGPGSTRRPFAFAYLNIYGRRPSGAQPTRASVCLHSPAKLWSTISHPDQLEFDAAFPVGRLGT